MAKHQSLDKRQEQLRRQLFGKEVIVSKQGHKLPSTKEQTKPQPQQSFEYKPVPDNDLPFLKSDLLKIITVVSLAIAAQLTLYWALNNHLISLPKIG